MRSIFTFTIALFILTACSQTPISITSTPLPSTIPTRIPTVTPTLSPAFTSTPELTIDQQAWQALFTANGYTLGVDKITTKDGVEVPGLKMDGDNLTITYAFPELGDDEFTIVLSKDKFNKLKNKITINEDGSIDMPGLTWDGQTVLQEHVTDDNGNEAKLIRLPYDVMIEIIYRESIRLGVVPGMKSPALARERLLFDDTSIAVRYGGVQFSVIFPYTYFNHMNLVDEQGKKVEEFSTPLYVYADLRGSNQSVVAMQLNGTDVKMFVDGKLGQMDIPLVKVQRTAK